MQQSLGGSKVGGVVLSHFGACDAASHMLMNLSVAAAIRRFSDAATKGMS